MFEDHDSGSSRIDLTPISPTEAARRMAAQQTKYDGWRKAETDARTADAARAELARQRGDRLTPDAAAAKLAEKMADPDWRDRYLGGNVEARHEAAALIEDKSAGSLVDSIMDGSALVLANSSPAGFTTRDGELPLSAQMEFVQGLRDLGVDDGSIRHTLADQEVTPAEHAAAKLARARLMSNREWTARYNSGDLDARATMMRLNIIVSSPIKAAA